MEVRLMEVRLTEVELMDEGLMKARPSQFTDKLFQSNRYLVTR
jgi:hypothetical protein